MSKKYAQMAWRKNDHKSAKIAQIAGIRGGSGAGQPVSLVQKLCTKSTCRIFMQTKFSAAHDHFVAQADPHRTKRRAGESRREI